MPRRRIDAAVVVFALLIVATVAAFAYAQRQKRDPLLVDRVEIGHNEKHSFNPGAAACANRVLRIKFRTTTSNDATVEVLSQPGGAVVKTLARERFLKRYTYHVLHWNGDGEGGGPEPSGRYRVRVTLAGEDRVLVLPGTIKLHQPKSRPQASTGPSKRFFRPACKGKGKSS